MYWITLISGITQNKPLRPGSSTPVFGAGAFLVIPHVCHQGGPAPPIIQISPAVGWTAIRSTDVVKINPTGPHPSALPTTRRRGGAVGGLGYLNVIFISRGAFLGNFSRLNNCPHHAQYHFSRGVTGGPRMLKPRLHSEHLIFKTSALDSRNTFLSITFLHSTSAPPPRRSRQR